MESSHHLGMSLTAQQAQDAYLIAKKTCIQEIAGTQLHALIQAPQDAFLRTLTAGDFRLYGCFRLRKRIQNG
jgi:hypothetical protein